MKIPDILYFEKDGKTPVKSPEDPAWWYTQVGIVRTQKGGPPQQLVAGKWISVLR